MIPHYVEQHAIHKVPNSSQLLQRKRLFLLVNLAVRQNHEILSKAGTKEEQQGDKGVCSLLGGHVPGECPAGLRVFRVHQSPERGEEVWEAAE